MKIGALEAGGTKMVCAVGTETGEIYDKISVPTEDPRTTMPVLIDFFRKHHIEALGIGCFGPVDLNRRSQTYGHIAETPKLAWRWYDIVGRFKKALDVPVGFDTDVNGSMLGEATFGTAMGYENAIYITVGTGIGVGVMMGGRLHHGAMHPEAGHIRLMRYPGDIYEGKCPYHKCCVEGLASGPAIMERWGKPGAELSDREEVWEMEAWYLAQAVTDYVYAYSPELVIIGGGVMRQEQLLPMIRRQFMKMNNDYVTFPALKDLDSYIVAPSLGDNQGVLGAIKLGLDAASGY